MDKLALRDSIALSNPADLTFADGMHRLSIPGAGNHTGHSAALVNGPLLQ
jgi:hypothetical protein